MKHKYTFRLQFERAGFVYIDAETPQDAIEEFEDNMDEYNEQCDYSYDHELHWQLIEEDGNSIEETQED